jgi:hypothetical protein
LCWPEFYKDRAGFACCEGTGCINARAEAESERRQAAAPVRDDQLQPALPPAALPPAPAPGALPPAQAPAALPPAQAPAALPPALPEEMAAMLREHAEEIAALKRQVADMRAAAALPKHGHVDQDDEDWGWWERRAPPSWDH